MYPSNGIHFLHPIKSSVVFFIISHLSIILQLFIVLFYILFEGQNSCGQEVISLDTILRLRELMNSRGWSEYRLAKESKLSMSTISNIFHRGSIPSIPTLETLCNTFGISLGQFFSKGVSFKWSKQKFVCGKIMVKRKITAKLAVIFRLTTEIPQTDFCFNYLTGTPFQGRVKIFSHFSLQALA